MFPEKSRFKQDERDAAWRELHAVAVNLPVEAAHQYIRVFGCLS